MKMDTLTQLSHLIIAQSVGSQKQLVPSCGARSTYGNSLIFFVK